MNPRRKRARPPSVRALTPSVRFLALNAQGAINATTLPPIKRRWPYGPGVRSPFSRFLALNAQVLQRGFHSNLHFKEGMAEAFTSCFSTCQKSGLKPGPIWPAPFNGWEEITNICTFDFRCALGALDNDRRIMGLNRIEARGPRKAFHA